MTDSNRPPNHDEVSSSRQSSSTHPQRDISEASSISASSVSKGETSRPKRPPQGYPQRARERSPTRGLHDLLGRRIQSIETLPFSPKQAPFFDNSQNEESNEDRITSQTSHVTSSLDRSVLNAAHPLTSSRYTRHLLLPQIGVDGQSTLLRSRVLIIGLGGLGSPAALYLAAAGVGALGFVDADRVEVSNLQRQIAHTEAKVGWSKVSSAADTIRHLNSDIRVVEYDERFEALKAENIMRQGWDLVLDCSDNPATRYLISDICVAWGIPLVSGAAQKLDGQLMILCWNGGDQSGNGEWPCYRCVFPTPPKPEMVQGCDEIGILGTTVGTIGVMMAGEAIKVLVSNVDADDFHTTTKQSVPGKIHSVGGVLAGFKPNMLLFSAFQQPMVRTVGLRRRRKDCLACSGQVDKQAIRSGRFDYVAFCGIQQDPDLLSDDERITAEGFTKRIRSTNEQAIVVDVRDKPEFDMGPTVKGSINIPISKVLRKGNVLSKVLEENAKNSEQDESDNASPVYVVCQRGNDSQFAVQKIKAQLEGSGRNIMDVKGGIEALARREPRAS